MRLNKLSHKSINSWLLFAALFAPIVYLFGSLFTTQLGAHGESVLADGPSSYVDMNVDYEGASYKRVLYFPDSVDIGFTFADSPNGNYDILIGNGIYYTDSSLVTANGFDLVASTDYRFYLKVTVGGSSIIYYSLLTADECLSFSLANFRYIEVFGSTMRDCSSNNPIWGISYLSHTFSYYRQPLSFTALQSGNADIEASRVIPIVQPTINVPASENNSEYFFGQFFSRDNFLSKSGKQVIEGTQNYGFQPMGELIRFTDANMLHLVKLEYGYLVIGYCYYAIHIIFVDLIVYLTLFIPRLIRMLVERLEGGVDL